MDSREKPKPPAIVPKTKKPYHKPVIVVYGSLGEITGMVGNMGNSDGGSGSMHGTRA